MEGALPGSRQQCFATLSFGRGLSSGLPPAGDPLLRLLTKHLTLAKIAHHYSLFCGAIPASIAAKGNGVNDNFMQWER